MRAIIARLHRAPLAAPNFGQSRYLVQRWF
jgi:hypothetical protein